MGKKSKRRPTTKGSGNKKKGGKHKTGDANTYSQIELLAQSQLIIENPNTGGYYGDGYEWTLNDEFLLGSERNNELYVEGEGELAGRVENMKLISNDTTTHPKGSMDALKAALESVWLDPTISNPHGVGISMGSKSEWMELATENWATCPDGVEMFWQEYDKDKEEHKTTLDKLSKEEQGGYCGSLDYILALNCILFDTISRLGLDHALPALNLYQALLMRIKEREPLYKMRMEVWKGYENIALTVMKAVQEHPLIPKPKPPKLYSGEIYPLENRGEFPPSLTRNKNESEETYEGACGFSPGEVEDLLEQGVRPWDNDAHAVLAVLNGNY